MSAPPQGTERPMFADVGRRKKTPGSNRSPSFLLIVLVGVTAAIVASYAEQQRRVHLVIVEVSYDAKP